MSSITFSTTDPNEVDLLTAAAATRAEFDRVPARKHGKILKRLISDNPIVVGIYVDGGKLHQHIIKGEMRLEALARCDAAIHVTAKIIQVREAAEAEAMRQVYGDGAAGASSEDKGDG